MFSQASIKDSVHRGGGSIHPHQADIPQADTPWTDTPSGQTPPWADTSASRHHPLPHRRPLQRTVRILLECILVCNHNR